MTTFEKCRREYMDAEKEFRAATDRYRKAEARIKITRAQLLDVICGGNQTIDLREGNALIVQPPDNARFAFSGIKS